MQFLCRNASFGRKGSDRLSFNVSKTWLEKVRPPDEPADSVLLEPFATVIEEHMNLIRSDENVSDNTVLKEVRENLVKFQEKDQPVEKRKFQTERRDEEAPFLDHNCCKKSEDHSLDIEKLHTQVLSSNGRNDPFVENMTLPDGVKGSDTSSCVDNKTVVNSDFASFNEQSPFDMEKEKKPPKKRKHLERGEDESGIEKALDQEIVGKELKRMKKVDSLNSMAKVPKGRR